MEQLIKITDHKGKQVVSARELHIFLESKQEFTNWIKKRINRYGLIEKQDFVSFDKVIKREIGSTTLTEYALTIDAAKELAMVEGNAKGKEARQYFINCEKAMKKLQADMPDFRNPIEAARAWADAMEMKSLAEGQIILLEHTIQEQAPKVNYYEAVLSGENAWPITVIATELGMSAIKLNQYLKEKKVQRKVAGVWVLTAEYSNKEFTKSKTHIYKGTDGNERSSIQTVWTEKGREFIHGLIKQNTKILTA